METFTDVLVFDLHGNHRKSEISPDGSPDENVFDIQQGVAIGLFCRQAETPGQKRPQHAEIWGYREEKYAWLANHDRASLESTEIDPAPQFYLFTPQDVDLRTEYEQGSSLTRVFRVGGVGMTTARDKVVIDWEAEPLLARAEFFRDSTESNSEICRKLGIPEKKGWDIQRSRKLIQRVSDLRQYIKPVQYRPFDSRLIFYHDSLVWRTTKQVMGHMLAGPNCGIVSARTNKSSTPDHFFCTRFIMETKCGEATTQSCLFPLYIYPISGEILGTSAWSAQIGGRQPNFRPEFVEDVSRRIGLRFSKDGLADRDETFGPEDVLHYAYSTFHSPTYRSRYAEFLKIDFPRLQVTSSLPLFRALTSLGGELVALHLMESPKLDQQIATYVGPTNPEVEKLSYGSGTVWLDKAQKRGFRGVHEEVWNFHIGGYQVCEKWLKDRKGRNLSAEDIEHYQRVVVAISETIRIMGEIDEVIEKHGGWPGAFQAVGATEY